MRSSGYVVDEGSPLPVHDSSGVKIYHPDSEMRHPWALFKAMVRDLRGSRELAWQLLKRDINTQYRQSLLGIFWAFVPPISAAIGLTFARNANAINVAETAIPYPAFVMLSMSLWQTFTEAISGPMQAVTKAKEMIIRVNFPREALIVAKVGEVLFNFGIKLLLIIGLFVFYDLPVTWMILLAPVGLAMLIMLGTAFGVILAPLGNLFNDFSRALVFVLSFWLLLTPVIYPLPSGGSIAGVVRFNPVTPVLTTTRELATTGSVTNPGAFLFTSGVTVVLLLAAWLYYRLAMPYVIERMSS